MERFVKLLLKLFFVSTALVLVLIFSKFYIQKDYFLVSEVDCDPQVDYCFVRECTDECEPGAEPTYYKIRTDKAYDIPVCDPHVSECPDIPCNAISSCTEEFCSDETAPEGESCSRPEDFTVSEPDSIPMDDSEDLQEEVIPESNETLR